MTTSKVKAGTTGLNFMELVNHSTLVHEKLSGNADYTGLTAILAVILGLATDVQDLVIKFDGGDRTVKNMRDTKFRSLRTQMGILAGTVNSQTPGDVDKLSSTGFEFVKDKTPQPIPGQVQRLTVVTGPIPGSAKLHWQGEPVRQFYEVQGSPAAGAEVWTSLVQVSNRRCTILGLATGPWKFKVQAVNASGIGSFSDVAISYVA